MGDFLAFIDDDETASESWLVRLIETAEATEADVVLGPVQAVYDKNAPRWMARGDFHSTFPVWVGDQIVTGYTCNALLRLAAPSLAGRRKPRIHPSRRCSRTAAENSQKSLLDVMWIVVRIIQAWTTAFRCSARVRSSRRKPSWRVRRAT